MGGEGWCKKSNINHSTCITLTGHPCIIVNSRPIAGPAGDGLNSESIFYHVICDHPPALPLLPCELSAIMDIIATLLNISPSVHTEESLTYDTNFFSRSSSRSSSNTVFARSKKRKHKGPRCRLEIIAASLKDDSIDHAAKSTGLDVAVVR